MSHRVPTFVLLGALVSTSGCGTIGVVGAAAPLLTALHTVGDRSVERTVPADLQTAWMATVDTLSRVGIRLEATDRSADTWALDGVGEKITVHAKLGRVTPNLTRVSLRVEAGGLLADKQTAETVFHQITLSLAAPSVIAKPEPIVPDEALAALREEIRRLRLEVEEERVVRGGLLGPAPAVGSALNHDGGIVEVPTSYGIPIVPASQRMPALRKVEDSPERSPALATRLRPADVLRPVQPLGVPIGQGAQGQPRDGTF